MLVFYPVDFSPVCTDQLSIYQEVSPRSSAKGVELVGISVDSSFSHKAFREKLGHRHTAARRLPSQGRGRARLRRLPRGVRAFANRSLVLVDADGTVAWSYASPSPVEIPGANLIFDALA